MIALSAAQFRTSGQQKLKFLAKGILPALGLGIFLLMWHAFAGSITTSLGQFPGPAQVWEQSQYLYVEHGEQRSKATRFYERQDKRNAKKLAKKPDAVIKQRAYTGTPTFLDQIVTSLYTVLFGFALASVIAIPLGIACGLSNRFYDAINPIIQILKPVSPLAWLPLVTMVVSAVYHHRRPNVR